MASQAPPPPSSEAGPSTLPPMDAPSEPGKKKPVTILCIGMAGSGKTTLMQRLNSYLHSKDSPPYILNLDPAVSHMPYSANIDIRDTVDYKEVMKQYNLGPNGGILTALNLFTTKFDQVLGFVEKRAPSVDYILIDTPGQIEIFTWSASGAIITDAIASSMPTVVAYIIDTPRTTAPATFMSNMLYACSILYKTRLPFILVFNKIDVTPHDFALEWMSDFEAYQKALGERGGNGEGRSESGYMDGLMGSMCLVLEEFYNHLRAVGVSAMTGQGMKEFFEAVEQARQEYESEYKPTLEKLAAEKKDRAGAGASGEKKDLEGMMKGVQISASSGSGAPGGNPFGPFPRNEREDRYMDEDEQIPSDEEESIRRQEEEEDEAAEAEDYDLRDMVEQDITLPGSRPADQGIAWPRPS